MTTQIANLGRVSTMALFSILCFSQSAKAQLVKPVATESGLVSGVKSSTTNVVAFKGIPYAAPPVGELRWREPQPPVKWEGTRVADKFCASCIQNVRGSSPPWTDEFMVSGAVSEDCLFLNIWTPAKKTNQKLPVLMFIHGGAFREGSGSIAVYDGEALANKGIIVVNINYRMGILGFFAHPELTSESPNHASGNYALLDQIAALQWIKKNIAAFGGDPKKVTIGGQSAGASSVHALTASPLAKGLFVRAIAESGSTYSTGTNTTKLADAEQNGVKFALAKGVASLKDLRALSIEQLTQTPVQGVNFGLIADGWFLPESIPAVFAQGKQNDVATLTGLNADEGSSSPTYGKTTLAAWKEQAQNNYKDQAEYFLKLYVAETDEAAGKISKEVARDRGMVSMYLWAKSRAATAKTSAFTYYFSRGIPWPAHPEFAAFHTSEIPYVFGNLKVLDRPWSIIDKQVSENMSYYWVNFISKGDPNGKGLPIWPAFNAN
ncbi:MAG TPA: carboxylesterase family protein, partial [Cyclobacteriaceae bacterium]|nr:carboxylesterase family protein [Cyclobacteriaceae bacterium]